MKKSDRKKLTANEYYIEQILSILYTKLKVIACNDENNEKSKIFNIENYEHGTISISGRNDYIRIALDGTNYVSNFYKGKGDSLVFRNDQLQVEYIQDDKCLEDDIHLKSIMRVVGDSADFIKYIVVDDCFFVMLEHYKKDEDGITYAKNNVAFDYNDQELVDYAIEAMEKANEIDSQDLPENKEQNYSKQTYEINEFEYDDEYDENEEIESFSSDEQYDDYRIIEYESSAVLNTSYGEKSYSCDFPDEAQNFDYENYIKSSKYVKDITSKPDGNNENKSSTVLPESQKKNSETKKECKEDENHDNQAEESQSFISNEAIAAITEELYAESDSIITGEGFINEDVYDVVRNGEQVEDWTKGELVDDLVVEVQDIDMEMKTLSDYYKDISTDLRKFNEIIKRRKEHIDKNKSEKSTQNKITNKEDVEDKNID